MTADEFERQYAARSGISVEQLRQLGREVRPCDCGEDDCEGWQSISTERAREYDANETIQAIVTQAIARMLYERETGRDWHRAPRDPGEDPRWLGRAKRANSQRPPATKI